MTIEQFTAALPAYLGFFQDKSPRTEKLKRYALELFVDYMGQEHPEQEITPEMVLGFRQSLYGLRPNTIAQYMKHIRAAFRFLLEIQVLGGENPINPLFVGREKYQPYDSLLTAADIQRILRDECPEIMTYKVYLRARAMTILCLTSGLRLAELLALKPEDLDWEGERAIVRHGKGDKYRQVPFHPVAQTAVKRYMDALRRGCPAGMPLFVNNLKGGGFKPLCERAVQKNIGSYVEAMTGRTDISPHDLRHSAASWWVSYGVPIREIQTLLGHTNIQTTERYASLVAPDTAPIRSANTVMTLAFGQPQVIGYQGILSPCEISTC